MTTEERVAALLELDELYLRAVESDREEDWEALDEALRAYEQRQSA